MTFIPIYLASYPTQAFFLPGAALFYVFVLACAGYGVGYILEKKVKGRFMIIGSAVYWVFAFLFLSAVVGQVSSALLYENPILYHSFNVAFWSTFLVLFADITYAVKYIARKRKQQARASILAQTPPLSFKLSASTCIKNLRENKMPPVSKHKRGFYV